MGLHLRPLVRAEVENIICAELKAQTDIDTKQLCRNPEEAYESAQSKCRVVNNSQESHVWFSFVLKLPLGKFGGL